MAQHIQFKGIKRVLSSNTAYTQTDSFLYFVRESAQATSGDIWFMGHHYGHFGEHDLDAINTALEGFLTGQSDTGYTNVKEYIDNAIAQVESNVTTVEKGENSFSGLTITEDSSTAGKLDYTITLTNVAPADELADEISARTTADAAIQAELDAVENSLGFNNTAYTQDGTYITGGTVAADIAILDEVLASYRSGSTEEIDAIEEAVGLNPDGSYSAKTGTNYLDNATSVEGEIDALDEALKEVADRTVTEGQSTEDLVTLTVATDASGNTTIAINDSALTAAIEAMDLAEVHEAGKAIVAVSEEDGVVSATAGTVAAEYVDVADAAGKFTGSTVEEVLAEIDTAYKAADEAIVGDASASADTLGKIEEIINSIAADAKEYHIVKETENLPAELKERYSLQDASGNTSGATIDIPKDSHIVSITYITTSGDPHYQNLEYVYLDVCGATRTEYVDMSQLVLEQEFASGVGVTNHVVHGVVDQTSEEFLTVGADGFKLDGVQDAIDAAETAATAYTQTQIEALDYADTAVTGQYVSEVDETNGVISVQRANVSEATLNNYSKGSDATAVAATDTVNQAISKLENQVDAAKAAATTKVEKDANANHITLSSATSVSDGSVTYTIGESDIASATALTETASTLYNMVTAETQTRESEDDRLEELISGLTDDLEAEIAARKAVDGQNGDTYAANTGANYISGATNLNDADVKLDTALKGVDDRLDTVEEKYLTGATVNGVNATVADNHATVTIDAGDIAIGDDLSGETVSALATDKVDDVLQSIITALDAASSSAYTGLTSSDDSLVLSGTTNGQDIIVNREDVTVAEAQDGHIELLQNNSGELYGAMYWIDEETA